MYRVLALALIILTAGCAGHPPSSHDQISKLESTTYIADPIQLDYGPIDRFNNCKAAPRRELSGEEQCMLAVLVADCTKKNDCFVSCMSSPHGHTVSGGCYHVCGLPSADTEPNLVNCYTSPAKK